MNDSYIKESIDELKQYLAEKQNVDKLLEQTDKVKSIIMESDYWNDRKKIIKQVLGCNVHINTENIVEKTEVSLLGCHKVEDKVVGYKCSIQGGSVIADLCNAFKVDIPQDLTTKFGQKLDFQPRESSNPIGNCGEILSNLQQTLKKEILETLNIDLNTKLSDDQIYQIVSRLPDYEEESKKLLLKSYRKTNGVENPDAELKQPNPDLFNLLEDKDLLKHINEYKKKSLEERKKDPLRMIFRCNRSTQNYDLNNITKNKTIKQWFESLIKGTPKEDRAGIYFVLLELFGKDFEFGGNTEYSIPKAKLWTKVDEKEAKEWYRKNMPDTDLFDNLQIGEEEEIVTEEEKIVITEEQNDNDINTLVKEDKPSIKNKNFYMDISKKNEKKNRTEKKQSETSKTGYKIGLFLDILITVLFIFLAIKISLLFLISLVVTLPIGIFCVIKLCECCLSSPANRIKLLYENSSDFLYSETIEPEYVTDQNNISLEGLENNEYEKPVKIVTKID